MYPDSYSGAANDAGVKVIRLSRRGLPLARFVWNRMKFADAIRRIHRANPIDILEGSELDAAFLNRSMPGVKVLRMHGGPSVLETGNKIQLLKQQWSLRVADQLCAVSQFVAGETRRRLGLGSRPIEVIWNPVDTDAFAPAPDAVEEDGLILFAGSITENKGIRQLVQAMPQVLAEAPNARLEVYGSAPLDPALAAPSIPELNALIPAAAAARIEWKGRVAHAELPAFIRRATVCVYPSHMEAMPIAWLEALAAGKAVVASQTGPGPEVIEDGVTGLLCDPRDPGSIARKIVRLLKDRGLRGRLGAAARIVAVERYSLEKIVQQNLAYYNRICHTDSPEP